MPDIALPTIRITTGLSEFTLRCISAAWSDQHGNGTRPGLLLVSAVGPDTATKMARACLYSPEIAAEFQLRITDDEGYESVTRMVRAMSGEKAAGYQCSVSRLAPGAIHMVAIARIPGLMPCLDDDRLWAELSSARYTTPLLRSWTGWIKRKLIEDGKIVMAENHDAAVGVLAIDPPELDDIVSSGVRWGYLKMET